MDNNMNSLIEQYGSPLYVYNEKVILRQINDLKSGIPYPDVLFCYAMKANSNLAVLKTMHAQGLGVDCVSGGELVLALKAGFRPAQVRFTPTFAAHEEIEFAVRHQAQITLDSISLLDWFTEQFPGTPIGLRMNPSVMAGAYEKTSVGHAKAKFGIGMNFIGEIRDRLTSKQININGLHIHSGSDILEMDQFMAAVEALLQVAPAFPALEYIDLGSGFKVSYFDGDKQTDIQRLGRMISERFELFCRNYGRPLRLVFEPGKFLVSQAGRFLVTCTGVKENGGITFAGVDSGFNHLIRPMFYGAYHTILNLTNPDGPVHKYDVVGNICETDTFASDRMIPEIRRGDILCFENAGAYCYSMASSYNTRPRPAEVYLRADGSTRLIRRRETIEDILAMQVE